MATRWRSPPDRATGLRGGVSGGQAHRFEQRAGQPPADRYITRSDLDALIAECGPRLWLCGHAHTTHHVTIGNTQISTNPRAGDGPGNVNPGFVDSYVLDL